MKTKVFVSILASLLALGQAQDICPTFACPEGTPTNCFLDPCSTARCPLYPDATCCSNTCGVCNYMFMFNGQDVTARCAQNVNCPLPGLTTSCNQAEYGCRADSECTDSQICCNSGRGCGTSCQDPVDICALVTCAVPLCLAGYTPVTPEGECCEVCRPTQTCPAPSTELPLTSVSGSCSQSCSDDAPCSLTTHMCCEIDSCSGRVCVPPVAGCTLEGGEVVPEGTISNPDNCTVCTCLRNRTISCEKTCIRECPDPSSVGSDSAGICAFTCESNTDCSQDNAYCCENNCGGTVCLTLDLMCRTRTGDLLNSGDTFMSDCNTCTCGDDGSISCTEIFCPEQGCPAPSGSLPEGMPCEYEEEDCVCSERQRCCRVYDDCDIVRSCVQPVVVCRHDDGTIIQAGESYSPRDVCETCTCSDGGVLTCDEPRDCAGWCEVGGVQYAPGFPVPSSDCNNCSCSPNGAPMCTLIACEQFCEGPNDRLIAIGESFESPNGCTNCTCTTQREIVCTSTRVCPDRCFQRVEVGDCDAVVPRYSYDQTRRVCSQFTWGGCGGNSNNFESIGDCLRACNRTSTCLATIYPSNQEPLCLIAPQRRWSFNVEAAVCREVQYIPCQSSVGYNVYQTEEECTRTCVEGEPEGDCPPDVPIVRCFADPCETSSCPNIPDVECEANYCGGCNAVYYDSEGNDVTARCVSGPTCEDGSLLVQCFIDPCDVSRCPSFPEATCRANYCGGCNAWYFNDGSNVTDRCETNRPTPLESLQCPSIESDVLGTCVQSCMTNDNCTGGMLCCSNGCGQTCQVGDSIPYYPLPLACPITSLTDFLGICNSNDDDGTDDDDTDDTDDSDDDDSAVPCTTNNNCMVDGEVCCRSGCGRTCQAAVRPSRPCQAVLDAVLSGSGVHPLGLFLPSCLVDGSFAPTQCHGSSCWCVNTVSGAPISSRTPIGTMPPCITCRYDGSTYYPGQSFPAEDGCNKCWCTDNGGVSCTRIGCEQPTRCSAEPDTGPCRGSIPAYYYDPEDAICKMFVWGGCGGNDNKYKTIRDCLQSCNPNSTCLLPAISGMCEAYMPSYAFNSSSGRCEQFVYGGCQGNDNRDTRGDECLDRCNPDGEVVDRCLDIACDVLECPPGSRFVSDDDSCCGGTCSDIECEDDEMMCRDGSECVSVERRCDILEDCTDGSDERDCPPPPRDCDDGRFLCGTGECLPASFRCDSYIDCRDRSDEQGCNRLPPNTQYISETPRECPPITDHLVDCEEDTCSNNGECDDDDEICCPTSCGSNQCIRGQPITPLCQALRRTRVGVVDATFIPECDSDGTFSSVQCYNNFCWCVDVYDGYPVTEGSRERPTCGCQLRDDDRSSLIPFGDTYLDRDGCNSCYCTPGWPNDEFCTNDRCPIACSVNGRKVEHGQSYDDECIRCKCSFGALNCTRKDCSVSAAIRRPTSVKMPFKGDFEQLLADDSAKEELKREVMRTMLVMYKDSLNLKQEQLTEVTLEKGSVIVTVELTDSSDTTSANLTILLSQLEQDFGSGFLVIRFGGSVLQPSGDIVVTEQGGVAGFPPWIIAVIAVAIILAIVAIVAIIITVVVCCRSKRSSKGNASPDDYDSRVAYTKTDETVKVPLD